MNASIDLSGILLSTAPDSWGVWFAEDPHQVTWRQYLDEVAKAGYVWTELGPQGFLPQDPVRLRDEYPVEADVPLPIAARTAGYFVACGLGPARRWPYRAAEGRTDR
jgi:sugar phosphate isomerase/epimerase